MANVYVKVKNEEARQQMAIGELLFGEGKTLSFEGNALALELTPEIYASLNPEFAEILEEGSLTSEDLEKLSEGIVYYDTGAERPYWIFKKDVELIY
jgi:hypothetical protein